MRWFVLVVVFAVTVTASMYLAKVNPTRSQTARARPLSAAGTTEAVDDSRIFAGGIVEGAQREIALRFEIAGRIKAVPVHEGDLVRAGDVLAELDTEIEELKLAEARTQLKMAIAERDQLIADSIRFFRENARGKLPAVEQQIRHADAILEKREIPAGQEPPTKKEIDQLRQKRDRAAAELQSLRSQVREPVSQLAKEEEFIAECKIALAEAAVRREELMFDKTRLRAPLEGVVMRVLPEAGELVGPADDRELFIVVNRDRTRVRAFVEELDALNVAPGQRAVVTAAGQPRHEYFGAVRTCSPYVGLKSHRHQKPTERLDVRVREVVIDLDDAADLLIGLPVEVFIEPNAS
jgi:HlyD family secretion protein